MNYGDSNISMKKNLNFIKKHIRPIGMTISFVAVSFLFFFGTSLFALPALNVFDGVSNPSSPEETATWGSNFGWVSFNCNNPSGNSCQGANYGAYLELDESSPDFGILSGEGWSSNLGWITFDTDWTGVCSSNPNAKLNGSLNQSSVEFKGWARAIVAPTSQNGYWDGCISLSSENQQSQINGTGQYAVRYIPSTGDIVGSAWGGELIGWLNFAAHVPEVIPTPDFPLVIFEANPPSIISGEFTTLSWITDNVSSCTVIENLEDPAWNPVDVPIHLPNDTWQTSTLTSDTLYQMTCMASDPLFIPASQIYEVYVSVSEFPILLEAPTLAEYSFATETYDSTVSWSSPQSFQSCELYQEDSSGTPTSPPSQPFSIVGDPGSVFPPITVPVNVPANPTFYRIDCVNPVASSNTVEIWQDQPEPGVSLVGQNCVVNESDPSWIVWDLVDINPSINNCSLTGSNPGWSQTWPSVNNNGGSPMEVPYGDFELSCPSPLGGSITASWSIEYGVDVCTPTTPPGTPDPDIFFEEF
jgi:hypothetical protein